MDIEKLIEDLRGLLKQYGEKIPYGELVGAPWPYSRAGDLVWPDPEPYFIEQAATALSALQAENAQLRAELERMKKIMRDNGIMTIPPNILVGRQNGIFQNRAARRRVDMKRLTERLENGVINVKYASQHESAIHRLVTIEDILGDEYDLDRLRELAQADQEGRCVVLPCKLHDKVFFIENGCVKETEVDSFHNWTSGRWKISTHTDRMYEHWKGYEIDFSGIGKTVFLSREDAEKALEEMEANENG